MLYWVGIDCISRSWTDLNEFVGESLGKHCCIYFNLMRNKKGGVFCHYICVRLYKCNSIWVIIFNHYRRIIYALWVIFLILMQYNKVRVDNMWCETMLSIIGLFYLNFFDIYNFNFCNGIVLCMFIFYCLQLDNLWELTNIINKHDFNYIHVWNARSQIWDDMWTIDYFCVLSKGMYNIMWIIFHLW